jgi:hypothetical protein
MAEITPDEIKRYLSTIEGQNVTISGLRSEYNLLPGSKSYDGIRVIVHRLMEQKILRSVGVRGEYRVVKRVDPIDVFGEPISDPITISFPRDFNTMEEMEFAESLIIREGDLVLISGRSNYGKTTVCMNFAGENIDSNPVLMGNEYTTLENKPSPRFMHRIKTMNWVEWQDENGKQKFTLLPVRSDYAEHIVKDRINIIDWINIDTGEHYMIGTIMESIKRELGKGIAIIAIQKAEGAEAGRGGQFTKDFADVEILLDKLPESDDVLLTLGKVKESKRKLAGKTYAYGIDDGVKIVNFREVVKCSKCYGKGWVKEGNSNKPCPVCHKSGYIDKNF